MVSFVECYIFHWSKINFTKKVKVIFRTQYMKKNFSWSEKINSDGNFTKFYSKVKTPSE